MTTLANSGLHDRDTGELERVFPQETWKVPGKLEACGVNRLPVLKWRAATRWTGTARPERGLLERFAGLCRRSDHDILTFAKKFGVLDVCDCFFPRDHAERVWP